LFVTAIGHKEDVSLVQKIADKAFITPTALGQYLNRIYNETVAELQHSKARFVETITIQLGAQYDKQVRNLEEKIRGLEELSGQRAGLQQRELEMALGQLITAREQVKEMRVAESRQRLVYWAVLVVVAIVCVVVGRGCK
jgi:exodeoxyribonuclease VII large subunit